MEFGLMEGNSGDIGGDFSPEIKEFGLNEEPSKTVMHLDVSSNSGGSNFR